VAPQHGFRTDDHQARAPIAKLRQQGQACARRGIDAPGFRAPLLEERQLTTQDQILGFDGSPGSDRERDQPGQVGQQPKDDTKQSDHAAMMPQPANSRATSSGRVDSSFCGGQAPGWRLSAGIVAMHENLRVEADSLDPTGPSALGNDPKFQWMLRSSFNVAKNADFDVTLRHVGALPDPLVPAYTAVDARIGWRVRPDLELSLTGQNLGEPDHVEFGAAGVASEIGRSVYLRALWRFR